MAKASPAAAGPASMIRTGQAVQKNGFRGCLILEEDLGAGFKGLILGFKTVTNRDALVADR
jgi:hypothetical protein